LFISFSYVTYSGNFELFLWIGKLIPFDQSFTADFSLRASFSLRVSFSNKGVDELWFLCHISNHLACIRV